MRSGVEAMWRFGMRSNASGGVVETHTKRGEAKKSENCRPMLLLTTPTSGVFVIIRDLLMTSTRVCGYPGFLVLTKFLVGFMEPLYLYYY